MSQAEEKVRFRVGAELGGESENLSQFEATPVFSRLIRSFPGFSLLSQQIFFRSRKLFALNLSYFGEAEVCEKRPEPEVDAKNGEDPIPDRARMERSEISDDFAPKERRFNGARKCRKSATIDHILDTFSWREEKG